MAWHFSQGPRKGTSRLVHALKVLARHPPASKLFFCESPAAKKRESKLHTTELSLISTGFGRWSEGRNKSSSALNEWCIVWPFLICPSWSETSTTNWEKGTVSSHTISSHRPRTPTLRCGIPLSNTLSNIESHRTTTKVFLYGESSRLRLEDLLVLNVFVPTN